MRRRDVGFWLAATVLLALAIGPHILPVFAGTDPYGDYVNPPITGPASHAFAITPHDTNELTFYTRGIVCGTAGNLNAVLVGDSSAVVIPISANVIHPLRIKILKDDSTTAATCVGLY